MPLFLYRCPKTGHRVQGFCAEDIAEDQHVYEPITCLACRQIHHVNPTTGAIIGESRSSTKNGSALLCRLIVRHVAPNGLFADVQFENVSVSLSGASC